MKGIGISINDRSIKLSTRNELLYDYILYTITRLYFISRGDNLRVPWKATFKFNKPQVSSSGKKSQSLRGTETEVARKFSRRQII